MAYIVVRVHDGHKLTKVVSGEDGMIPENKTRMGISTREAVEHVLTYLATERNSELDMAISAVADARALAHTKLEKRFVARLQRLIGDTKFAANVQVSARGGR